MPFGNGVMTQPLVSGVYLHLTQAKVHMWDLYSAVGRINEFAFMHNPE